MISKEAFLKLITPTNWGFWVLIGLLMRVVQVYLFQSTIPFEADLGYVYFSGDSWYYLELARNFINEGEFFLFNKHIFVEPIRRIVESEAGSYLLEKNYCFRMPGYPMYLALFMLLFGQTTGITIAVYVQVVIVVVALYLLARLVQDLTESKWAFYLSFFLLMVSLFFGKWSFSVMSEPLAFSFLTISIYLLQINNLGRKQRILALAGVCVTGAVFMRPFLLPILFLLTCLVFIRKFNVKSVLVFLIPFLLIEGAWITRNYIKTSNFILLESSADFYQNTNPVYARWVKLAELCGENKIFWSSLTMGGWIMPMDYLSSIRNGESTDEILPDYFTKDVYRLTMAHELRSKYHHIVNDTLDYQFRLKMEKEGLVLIDSLRDDFLLSHSFVEIAVFRIRGLYRLIMSIPAELSYRGVFKYPFNVIVSAGFVILNTVVLFFGLVASVLVLFGGVLMSKKRSYLVLSLIPLSVMFVYGIAFAIQETRALSIPFSFLLANSVIVFFDKNLMGTRNRRLLALLLIVSIAFGVYRLIQYIQW